MIRRFILIIVNLWLVQGCTDVLQDGIGTMYDDQNILIGSPLEVKCTLLNNSITDNGTMYQIDSSYLYIKKNSSVLKTKVIDNKTISYFVNVTQVHDANFYICYLNRSALTGEARDPLLVCLLDVYIGKPPEKLKEDEFNCTSLAFKSIRCEWINQPKTKYILTYIQPLPLYHISCNPTIKQDEQKAICEFIIDGDLRLRYNDELMKFVLNITNPLGSIEQTINFENYSLFLPSKPRDFNVVKKTPSSLYFNWSHPEKIESEIFIQPLIVYQITYEYSIGQQRYNNVINLQNQTSYLLENLFPYTLYEIKLKCRMKYAKYKDLMWSKSVSLQIETDPDVPYYSPNFNKGVYEMTKSEYGRDILVYWKPIERKFRNAENFSYVINAQSNYTNHTALLAPDLFYHQFQSLSCNTEYNITIRSVNKLGACDKVNNMIIETCDNVLDSPEMISLTEREGFYHVYWTPLPYEIDYYTLVWCRINHLNMPKKPCIGPYINSTIVKSHTRNFTIFLDFPHKFGVSASLQKTVSPLKWISCVDQAGSTTNQFKSFEVTMVTSHSFEVTWDLICPDFHLSIFRYKLIYCEGECSESNREEVIVNNTVNNIVKTLRLSNLKYSTTYIVNLIGFTRSGDEITVKRTVKTTVPLLLIIMMGLAVLFSILILIVIGLISWKSFMKKIIEEKEIKKEVKTNWVPKMPTKLQGTNVNVILNPLCQENNSIPGQYENKEYMNSEKTKDHLPFSIKLEPKIDGKKNLGIILNSVLDKNGQESKDSGLGTKNSSYCKKESELTKDRLNIDGLSMYSAGTEISLYEVREFTAW